MSKEAQEVLVRDNAWPSIRPDVYDEVSEAQRPTFAAIQQALKNGWFRPSVSYWPAVSARLNDAVDRIVFRQEPVRPVLDELHNEIEAAALPTRKRWLGCASCTVPSASPSTTTWCAP